MTLFSPPDVLASGVMCGPAAFAALLGRQCSAVAHLFDRSYVTPTAMQAALASLGHPAVSWDPPRGRPLIRWPDDGLVFVQIDGPWCNPGVPAAAAYRHTHWIAVREHDGDSMVYDVNAGTDARPGEWLRYSAWEGVIAPMLVAATERATGWYARKAFGLTLPRAARLAGGAD